LIYSGRTDITDGTGSGGMCDLFVGDSSVASVIYVYGFIDIFKGDVVRIELPKLRSSSCTGNKYWNLSKKWK